MSTDKEIEVIGTSSTSWEDAAAQAVKAAGETIRDLRVAEVVEQDIHLDEAGAVTYRTKLQLSFKYEHGGRRSGRASGSGVSGDPFDSGVALAEARLARYNLRHPSTNVADTFALARDLLNAQGNLPERAIELFAELVAVGASMRVVFDDESELNREELHEFLVALKGFTNSWFHRPPE